MIPSKTLSEISKRQTPALLRALAMGFILEHSEVCWDSNKDELVLKGRFLCVCGKYENFNFRISIDHAALDPAKLLQEKGAFSSEHLELDGYTPEEIINILTSGTSYDLAHI